jgi:hypothetical protein
LEGSSIEEHIFLKQEDIVISSTRIVIPNKIIAMHSVSSVTIDKEDIKFPRGMIIASILCFLVWIFNPNVELGEVGLFIGITLLLIGGIIWLVSKSNRKEAVVISLTSGETEFIEKHEVDDIQSVFNAIGDAIVFRG